jgi:branched-chain amino acid transport system permease protein
LLLVLFLVQFVLPDYHHANLARIMIYAVLAMGYNLAYGYTGLMSLGHALFFAAGAYGAGTAVYWGGFGAPAALLAGLGAAVATSAIAGLILVRVTGVALLIVTLMLAQAGFLSSIYFNRFTMGEQGMVLPETPPVQFGALSLRLADPNVKYNIALAAFAVTLAALFWLVRSPVGRVLIAIRENEPRTRMLGYNTFAYRYFAVLVSGSIAGSAGALYCLLFSYVGASFGSLQYSTLPLLWTLLGGAGTVIGPFIGTFLMFYLTDIASSYTSSYMLFVGLALLAVALWFPKGAAGFLRARWPGWLA